VQKVFVVQYTYFFVGSERVLHNMLAQIAKASVVSSRQAIRGSGFILSKRAYHEKVVEHYNNPRNVGSFDKNDPSVGTGLVGAPACGDVMKLQIKVDEATGEIVDACFKTFGCGSAIASSSVASEWIKGKPMDEAVSIKNSDIAKHLSLPPVKLHCSMLAEDAIKAAVKDYQQKKEKLSMEASTHVEADTVAAAV
jgi:Fe-S cluster assembly scaffold IscU